MNAHPKRDRFVGIGLLLLLAVLVAVGFWKVGPGRAEERVAVETRPERVMGTECLLAATVRRRNIPSAERALGEAEAVLRRVEAKMSSWLAESEISRLNRAEAGEPVALSAESIAVLRLARDAVEPTGGAFDATCRPLIELWREAARADRLPSDEQIAAARGSSHWDQVELDDRTATKRDATAQVDLGGIAKGHAIDRALAAVRAAGVEGGLVDVGGDVAVFGKPPKGSVWPVEVRNPFGPGVLTRLQIVEGAVCTSGDYARGRMIEGRRYSHIIDPRTGRPARSAPSVTVMAPDAVTADIWATALSVLGPEGLERLPGDVEAILIKGSESDYKTYCTPGVFDLLESALPGKPMAVYKKTHHEGHEGYEEGDSR
ncbi:MAG: FAD:protein FMN transferase [Pirellulaceae bacterium]|nr:FAD:protein FMN transferase [Pirellulaceae bacterium]